jgi:2'-5' RNA ligase/GNAT superfamily N-acetyltransferase
LGVALLLDPPVSVEVDGLRRGLGDPSLDRIAPHLALVPPVNVREADVAAAVSVIFGAAHAQPGPVELSLGPVATFAPASPVLYLSVEPGTPGALERLGRLRGAVNAGPLRKAPRWPWAPHVTICDEVPAEGIEPALQALGCYRAGTSFDRVVLMEEVGHRWVPLADAVLGPPAVVGRGGLELELTEGRLVPPEARSLLPVDLSSARPPPSPGQGGVIVVTGRREGAVVGVAQAWAEPAVGARVEACVGVAAGARGQGVGRALLARLEVTARQRAWAAPSVVGHGPAGFFGRCSPWVTEVRPV